MKNKIIQGDCLEVLKTLDDNSVDSIVTDPPAGISFMGKSWDTDKGGRDNWIKWMQEVATECKRVLKPGGHAFVWAIPRTSHWTATAWENAGFEIRDVVAHVFGSGFPKSHNIEKALQKIQPERSNEFKGIGTALKPAREDWILMRKPLDKGLSIAENCLKYGTGGINIDESRVATNWKEERPESWFNSGKSKSGNPTFDGNLKSLTESTVGERLNDAGRFPANLLHDNSEEVRECFPETKPTKPHGGDGGKLDTQEMGWGFKRMPCDLSDNGGNASRFFKSILYYPKASKSERNKGCEGLEEKEIKLNTAKYYVCRLCGKQKLSGSPCKCENPEWEVKDVKTTSQNNHPTVKPIALMEYLIKMVTKPGGIVLDPFAGSGSTLVAAKQNGFHYIGIEMEADYIKIAEARLQAVPNKLF